MPRNSVGTYALPPNTEAVPGDDIVASKVNTRFGDLAAEQNAVRPVAKGGTGRSSITAFFGALGLKALAKKDQAVLAEDTTGDLPATRVSGLGPLATAASVAVSSLTGNFPASRVSGLVAWATRKPDVGTETTGDLPTTRITGQLSTSRVSGLAAWATREPDVGTETTGVLPTSRITGDLPSSRVTGLGSMASQSASNYMHVGANADALGSTSLMRATNTSAIFDKNDDRSGSLLEFCDTAGNTGGASTGRYLCTARSRNGAATTWRRIQ